MPNKKIIVQAYSPLDKGKNLNHPILVEMAQIYNKTTAQLMLRWNVQIETVPIPKSVTKSRIKSNFDIFDFKISKTDMLTLNGISSV